MFPTYLKLPHPLSFSETPKQKPRDNGFHELFKSLSWIQGDNGWWCFLCTKTMIIARWCHSTSNHFVVLGKAIGQTGNGCHIQLGTSLSVNWVGLIISSPTRMRIHLQTVIGSWVGMVRKAYWLGKDTSTLVKTSNRIMKQNQPFYTACQRTVFCIVSSTSFFPG